MSFKASKWARVQRLHKTPKSVLTYLAERAHNDGFDCFPGQALIATETGLSERTVRIALKYLEEMGFISRARQYRKDGYRSSDTIEVLVSDEEVVIEVYGQWYERTQNHRQEMQSYRQGLPTLPAGAAGPREEEGEQSVRSITSTADAPILISSSSSSSSDVLKDALVEMTREMVARVPGLPDEELMAKWDLVSMILPGDEGLFADKPDVRQANQEFTDAVWAEVSRRCGVS